jgi:hypothetical protein
MSQNDERRVLNRMGARQLSDKECEQVRGAIIHTGVCTIDPKTCAMDNDCPVPIGC